MKKCVVIGVTGGIAVYKALDIISALKKKDIDVRVIMTESATKFVNPITFQSLSNNAVAVDTFQEIKVHEIQHISLAQRADLMLIAPATANIIGKVANGIADDMLSTTIMACKSKVIFAPAMNTNMYENRIVQDNIEKLKGYGYGFIEPGSGRLACGDIGVGKLADVSDIVERVLVELENKEQDLIGKKVLISAGPTIAPIDPVRFITNRSTGKMGYSIAKEARDRGADVVLVSGPTNLPQIKGMSHGDAARKQVLVDYGFRLPCAKDNRPLKSEEFFSKVGQKIYISATPGEFEKKTSEQMVEQIIRPTGLVDPKISVRPIETQIGDLKIEIEKRAKKEERVLITTLTKRMAEDLCDFFLQEGIRVRYLHSGIKSIERVEILRDLRLGEFDVLIGVNLLREGLDIPEVSLVAIMDADKEGFLRSETSLIQTIGRAARNACGEVIMYADKITDSMQKAIDETNRRREIQLAHNKKFGIIPQTIKKPIENNLLSLVASYRDFEDIVAEEMVDLGIDKKDLPKLINKLEKDMHKAAKILDFERAAEIRDKLKKLREMV